MTILLDTHVVLWWHDGDRRLSPVARRAIERAELVLVSAASAWEVALELGSGKLRLEWAFDEIVTRNGFTELAVTLRHARQLEVVPMRHRDPFDRMLVAQAMVEKATLVSKDRALAAYGIDVLWG
jgi:PIN domain nuclease of toxin-antitoxin system